MESCRIRPVALRFLGRARPESAVAPQSDSRKSKRRAWEIKEYAECRSLVPGEAVLVVDFLAVPDEYDDHVQLLEEQLTGIVLRDPADPVRVRRAGSALLLAVGTPVSAPKPGGRSRERRSGRATRYPAPKKAT